MKKIISLLLAGTMLISTMIAMSGCGSETTNEPTDADTETQGTTYADVDLDELMENYPKDINYDDEHEVGYQLEKPQDGEQIAILHTSMGDITMRLFPENAPNTVTNFVELAKSGAYDNVPFHRVIDDFMIQTGDITNGDGTGGKTYNGEILYDEFCDKLFNIRGSVAMANSGRDTNGSQFFINQTKPEALSDWSSLKASWEYMYEGICSYYNTDSFIAFVAYYGSNLFNPDLLSDEVKALYEANGGNPHLDGYYNYVDRGHTVFAQVIDGMDIVDAIAGVEVDDSSKPTTEVLIKTVEITTYNAG